MDRLILKWRRKLLITQKQLANNIGVHQSTISRIEHNCFQANYKIIFKILIYFKAQQANFKSPLKTVISKNLIEFLVYLSMNEESQNIIENNPKKAANFFLKSLRIMDVKY